ncbi:MAG: hypothetical protein Q9213_003279 [Squamulea squamosa]
MEQYTAQQSSPRSIQSIQSTDQPPTGPSTIASPVVETTVGPRLSLRNRLSRHFGSTRIPRQARAKSLTHLKPDQPQAQDNLSYLQPRPTTHGGQGRQARTLRRATSTPTVSHPAPSSPRFIGLEDRHTKIPVAIPTFVRRVKFQLSSDHTMATRGSGSRPSDPTADLDDTASGIRYSVDVPSGANEQSSKKALKGDKKRRGVWASIKRKAMILNWRKKADNT